MLKTLQSLPVSCFKQTHDKKLYVVISSLGGIYIRNIMTANIIMLSVCDLAKIGDSKYVLQTFICKQKSVLENCYHSTFNTKT